jgi:hypothetical protein
MRYLDTQFLGAVELSICRNSANFLLQLGFQPFGPSWHIS